MLPRLLAGAALGVLLADAAVSSSLLVREGLHVAQEILSAVDLPLRTLLQPPPDQNSQAPPDEAAALRNRGQGGLDRIVGRDAQVPTWPRLYDLPRDGDLRHAWNPFLSGPATVATDAHEPRMAPVADIAVLYADSGMLPPRTFGKCGPSAFPDLTLPSSFMAPTNSTASGAAKKENACFTLCWESGVACEGYSVFNKGACMECCEDLCRNATGQPPRKPEPLAKVVPTTALDVLAKGAQPVDQGPGSDSQKAATKEGNAVLVAAILRGDIDGVKSAVYDDSADPNSCLGCRDVGAPLEIKPCGTCFNGSFAALHLVAEQWKTNPGIDPATWPAMIDVLVADLGAQPNLLDYQPEESLELRVPALDYALAAHDAKSDRGKALPVVEALIHNGAEVNFSRWNGWTLLMLAAQNVALGGPELVQVLVRQGADVNAKNVRGFTALHLAAECWAASNETCGGAGEGDIVKWLVEEGGADPDIQESAGYTAKSMIQEACLTPLQGLHGVTDLCSDAVRHMECKWGQCGACCDVYQYLTRVTDPSIHSFDSRVLWDGRQF